MKLTLANRLRLFAGQRPHLPFGTTYVLDGGVTSGLWVMARAANAAADDMGVRVGPWFQTYEAATAYRDWLNGTAARFVYPDGAA